MLTRELIHPLPVKAVTSWCFRVSWRYARGIITSDNSLFARWTAPWLDRVVLDPVREENAGKKWGITQFANDKSILK